jgi:transposase
VIRSQVGAQTYAFSSVSSQAPKTIRCMDRVELEGFLSEGLSLAEIGRRVELHEATVAYWLKKHGLQAVNHEKHAARGALGRADVEPLVDRGMSVAQIAETVGRSTGTVRHWLREYGLKTRTAERRHALTAQTLRVTLDCPSHGATIFQLRSGGGYRCLQCRSDAVTRRRRRVKRLLVEEAGGACQACGYDRCIAALHFHHLDPNEKAFSLSHRGVARSISKARAEAKKCALLCSNCHVEVETGLRVLS